MLFRSSMQGLDQYEREKSIFTQKPDHAMIVQSVTKHLLFRLLITVLSRLSFKSTNADHQPARA